MAYTFSTGNTPATASLAMYLLKTTLVTAGWTVTSDSDGTTYNATGGQVTSGAGGAGGLGNVLAWIRLQAPTVGSNTREIIIQRNSSVATAADDQLWRIKYSANAGFTGGSPGATRTPSATDEVIMIGAGTDASPTFFQFFGANGGYRWHIMAGGATELYSFMTVNLNSTTTNINGFIGLDVLKSGTYPSEDIDPAVFCTITATVITQTPPSNNSTNPSNSRAWLGATSAAGNSLVSNNVNVGLDKYSTVGGSTGIAVNPFSSKDTLWSPIWMALSSNPSRSPFGVKGASTIALMGSVVRTNLDTITSVGTRDLIYLGHLWLPWDGSVPTA